MPALRKATSSPERYHIRSVDRALTLLDTFLVHEGELSVSEISKAVKLGPSTVFRMLLTLEKHGFVEQVRPSGKYRLGTTCLELGSRFLKSNDLRDRTIDILERLRNEFGETVHLTILQDNQVIYLEKLAGLHPIGLMSSRVGDRNPAHCTGVGKALLAYLPDEDLRSRYPGQKLARFTEHTITDWRVLRGELDRVRSLGYAVDDEEHEPGVKCVAVPTFNHKGIVAAMSVSGPVERMDEHIARDHLIPTLQKAGEEVSVRLGWGRGVDQLDKVPAPSDRTGHRSPRPERTRRPRRGRA
jgi:IclR family acetate operon transcriptional repressor